MTSRERLRASCGPTPANVTLARRPRNRRRRRGHGRRRGVPAEALRVLFRAACCSSRAKRRRPPGAGEQTYHLVEREFGRFARAVRLTGAFDVADGARHASRRRADDRAAKLDERRGAAHRIPIDACSPSRAMNILFVGDIVGRPGRELIRKGLRALVDALRRRPRDRQRREFRRRIRRHQGHRRHAARVRAST